MFSVACNKAIYPATNGRLPSGIVTGNYGVIANRGRATCEQIVTSYCNYGSLAKCGVYSSLKLIGHGIPASLISKL